MQEGRLGRSAASQRERVPEPQWATPAQHRRAHTALKGRADPYRAARAKAAALGSAGAAHTLVLSSVSCGASATGGFRVLRGFCDSALP